MLKSSFKWLLVIAFKFYILYITLEWLTSIYLCYDKTFIECDVNCAILNSSYVSLFILYNYVKLFAWIIFVFIKYKYKNI